jgi:hypothetical protein
LSCLRLRAGGAPVDTGMAAPPPGGEDEDLMRGRYFADAKRMPERPDAARWRPSRTGGHGAANPA